MPVCDNAVKLAPPEKPNVNDTTVSWKPVWKNKPGQEYQLQWKQEDQSWNVSIYIFYIYIKTGTFQYKIATAVTK